MHLKCRAQVSGKCQQGKEIKADIFRQDGTYDDEDDTVVCTPCYIVLGQPGVPQEMEEMRIPVINAAIERHKGQV